jgi:hypothetical protein
VALRGRGGVRCPALSPPAARGACERPTGRRLAGGLMKGGRYLVGGSGGRRAGRTRACAPSRHIRPRACTVCSDEPGGSGPPPALAAGGEERMARPVTIATCAPLDRPTLKRGTRTCALPEPRLAARMHAHMTRGQKQNAQRRARARSLPPGPAAPHSHAAASREQAKVPSGKEIKDAQYLKARACVRACVRAMVCACMRVQWCVHALCVCACACARACVHMHSFVELEARGTGCVGWWRRSADGLAFTLKILHVRVRARCARRSAPTPTAARRTSTATT